MSDQQTSSGTPWHLWVVGGLMLVWNGMAAFDYIATIIRYEPYLSGHPEEILNYYFNAPAWMYALWGIASFGGFVGSVFILLRRKVAVPLFSIAWVSSVIAAVYTFQNPPPQGADPMFYFIVFAVSLLVIFYLVWMSRRGVLR